MDHNKIHRNQEAYLMKAMACHDDVWPEHTHGNGIGTSFSAYILMIFVARYFLATVGHLEHCKRLTSIL